MTGISSSVGLLSGLPTQDLIDSILAVESRPMQLLQRRVQDIQTQRTAYVDLSARLLSLKSIVSGFKKSTLFETFKAASSDDSVLTATAGSTARPGSIQFIVHSLVTNHQLIASGMPDPDTTPVGRGTLTVEIGHGKLDPATPLDRLNGGEGIRRGTISITDRNGDSVKIDLSTALTVEDIISEINTQSEAAVRAIVSGDRIIIEDQTGLTEGTLSVSNVSGGFAATDLGIKGQEGGDGRIVGTDIVNLTDASGLNLLNDGNGIRRTKGGDDFQITDPDGNAFSVSLTGFLDFNTRLEQLNNGNGVRLGTVRITDRSGASADVDLTSAQTIQDVLDAINDADVAVRASFVSSRLLISDESDTPEDEAKNLKIEDVDGFAAQDLGIAGDVDDTTFSGSEIFRITTIGDVIRAINFAEGNYDGYEAAIRAEISEDGNGITLSYNGTGTGPIVVEALAIGDGSLSQAAADLGIVGTFNTGRVESGSLIAGLNTVLLRSLNGGAGVDTAGLHVTARDGTAHTYDLSAAQTIQDVLDTINADTETSHVSARLNAAGNGIEIIDKSEVVSGTLRIAESGGTTAADLGILAEVSADAVNSGNLQLRYISESTRLEDLNYGDGVQAGQFRIVNSNGVTLTFNVTDSQKDLGDIINLINARSTESGVMASINANGDGLLLTDTSGGDGTMRVEDVEGTPAASLNIAGEADPETGMLDGSLEVTIAIDADDTLNDVIAKLNDAGGRFTASTLNDGSSTNPYRLTVTSDVSGRRGELIFDVGDTGLSMDTMVQASDAVVVLGGAGTGSPILVSSSTNTLDNLLEGVSINLIRPADDPVQLTVSQDIEKVISDFKSFVTNFNAVQDRIDDLTSFDPETEERGPLLGDSTVRRVRDRLYRTVIQTFDAGSTSFNRLTAIGFRVANGGRLEFDEDKFREMYAENPAAIETLFTDEEGGIGVALDELLDELTRSGDGLIARRDSTLGAQEEDLTDRIEHMQVLLEGRRSRLELQFQGLEAALAQLQSQQSALAGLTTFGS